MGRREETAASASDGSLALALLQIVALASLAVVALRGQRALQRERQRSAALRAALEARIWEDQVREVEQLEETVRELRRRGHDVNNALSAALLSTQLFFDASRAELSSEAALAEVGAAADGMVEALQRLKTLIETSRKPETTAAPTSRAIRPVGLLEAVNACAERTRARHRSCELHVHEPAPELASLRVAVCAGELGLARALDALFENACAAGGAREAPSVEVRFGARREVDVVVIEIHDDGPGFTQTELSSPITAFESSQRGALGLGLYTAERIARASGGSLRRANAKGGKGALVSLFLPVFAESGA